MRTNLPRAIRELRLKRGWRQADLATRAACTRQAISRLETGRVSSLKLATLDAIVQALGGSLDVIVRWHGATLDHLLDAAHAGIVEIVAAQLEALGWETRLEVSFNHYGDRGRVDILAFHRASGTLLVVEVKTALGDVQDTLGANRRQGPPGTCARRVGGLATAAPDAGGSRDRRPPERARPRRPSSRRVRAVSEPGPAGAGVAAESSGAAAGGSGLVRESTGCHRGEHYARAASPSCTRAALMSAGAGISSTQERAPLVMLVRAT